MKARVIPHTGSGWIVQAQPTNEGRALLPGIPPTAVGGLFKHSLQTKAERCFREYHPRQWVDRSNPAYKRRPSAASGNTTHGSGWIVQIQPTNEGRALLPGIPPTAVGGSFKSSLGRTRGSRFASLPRGAGEDR